MEKDKRGGGRSKWRRKRTVIVIMIYNDNDSDGNNDDNYRYAGITRLFFNRKKTNDIEKTMNT